MRKFTFLVVLALLLALTLPLYAQDATPEATPAAEGEGTEMMGSSLIAVSDQLSLDGTVVVQSATSAGPGWLAIHVDLGGTPGPTVGIAPLADGVNENVIVAIDVLGATPALLAVLHTDDGQPGAYEFEMRQMADPMQMGEDGQPVLAPFRLTAVRVFDQQVGGSAIIGSVISEVGGFIVIHADDGGNPGPVLGYAPLMMGTNPAVIVPLVEGEITPVLHAMIHVDDNTPNVYEFGEVEGADAPLVVNDTVANATFNTSETVVILTAAGVSLEAPENVFPSITASGEMLEGVGVAPEELAEAPVMTLASVISVGQGWIDVHADAGGHPGASLGVAPVNDGENTGVQVPLDQSMTAMPMPIPPLVWPMLHIDDNQPGVYEWLVIPGADAPVVVNGAVVTIPTAIGDPSMMGGGMGEMTEEAPTGEATAEATPGG
ncbi:MAG: hypothetical protein SF029_08260 [bacterium]|nr:hypothetical protein [bacterium]